MRAGRTKHEMRGKRRLHKRPNNYEVERCKIWLDDEMRLVKPTTVAAFGVTAARALTGRPLTIGKVCGQQLQLANGRRLTRASPRILKSPPPMRAGAQKHACSN